MSEIINNLVEKLKVASDGETAVKGLATEFYRELVTECTGMVRDDADVFLGTFEAAYRTATYGWTVKDGSRCRIIDGYVEMESDKGRHTYNHDESDPQCLIGRKWYKVKNAPMPTAYRTAKTTILKAIDAGVELADENGEPMTKAALTRAAKSVSDPFADKLATLMRTVNALAKIQDKGATLDPSQEAIITDARSKLAAILDANTTATAAAA